MADLRFAVLLPASSFGVLLLLLLAASASASASRPPAVYGVGDEWRKAMASNDSTHQTLNKWAMRHRFYVGDVLDFNRSKDTVLLVSQGDYKRCRSASPELRFPDSDGDTGCVFDESGLFYFISSTPGRCEAGQRMVVRVVDARSSLGGGGAPTPAPAPAPGPGTMEPADVDSPSGDRPIPVWFKLFVPAVIGFLGGCSLAAVIIWMCMNLRRRRRHHRA